MENPAYWNDVMKAVNSFPWDYKTVSMETVNNLINSLNAASLLTSTPSDLQSVVQGALEHHLKALDVGICGGSLGLSMYHRLKEIGAVE